jgi:transposase-like protein
MVDGCTGTWWTHSAWRKAMPFKECSTVSQREEFCRLAGLEGANRRELFRRFGISPSVGYKWLSRYQAEGPSGLEDRSRRPRNSPKRTEEDLEAQVLAVRAAHPVWGGRKIRRVLLDEGIADAPAASTITDILRRHNLLDGPGSGRRGTGRALNMPSPTTCGRWISRATSPCVKGVVIP